MVAPQPRPEVSDSPVVPSFPCSIRFPSGLVGCPNWQRFTLRLLPDLPGLVVMRCDDEEGIQFILAEVEALVPDYRSQLAPDDAAVLVALGVGYNAAVRLYCTLTIHDDGAVTANLLGPLVLDFARGCGVQVVLANSRWPVRYPVLGAVSCSS